MSSDLANVVYLAIHPVPATTAMETTVVEATAVLETTVVEATAVLETTVVEATAVLEADRQVQIVTSDGKAFVESFAVMKISGYVEAMLSENTEDEIPMHGVSAKVLVKIIDFCKHYHLEPMTPFQKPLQNADLRQLVQDFYASFIAVDNQALLEIILAADYMHIQPLIDLCQARIASLIRDQTVEQIKINLAMPDVIDDVIDDVK